MVIHMKLTYGNSILGPVSGISHFKRYFISQIVDLSRRPCDQPTLEDTGMRIVDQPTLEDTGMR